jgi:two-component system nitrogen regulation response regulator GlnG
MQQTEAIWVVDDDQSIRWVLEKALTRAEMEVKTFDSAATLLKSLKKATPAAIISDIRMPDMDGFELLAQVQSSHQELPVIIMTAHSDMDSAVSAFESGAFEYLPKPFDINEATELARRAQEHSKNSRESVPAVQDSEVSRQTGIIGKSFAMQGVFRAIGRLSKSSISVLITGESGTGKELVAAALHEHSPRSKKPFIAINTAAIPKDLLESELFGHEKGAFTGAHALRKGRFEQADHGTLFLDEIGDMSADLQTRLLRVLSDGKFYRVGGHIPVDVDVRVVAATHQALEDRVAEGLFREDLFHRLNVIRIQLPPLRERSSDIPLLLSHFLQRAADDLQTEKKVLLPNVIDFLQTLPWPGNVRQLENISRWMTVMAAGRDVAMDDLPPELFDVQKTVSSGDWRTLLAQEIQQRLEAGESRILDDLVPEFERLALEVALQKTAGRKKDAAELLGWGRNTLTRKLKEIYPTKV